MEIRHTKETDIDTLQDIYARARRFMAETGNPRQWGANNWPPESLLWEDIAAGKSYVCVEDGRVIGSFFYDYGPDIEPTYLAIEEGSWLSEEPYGVVHRIASDGSTRGVGEYCLNWALTKSGHLRIDTHPDNIVMQRLLKIMGFERRGIIYVTQDPDPREAYEKIVRRT